MKRLFSLLPALALLLAGPGIAAAQDDPCIAPDGLDFVCGELLVTLVPDADIEEVLERSAPDATVQANVGQNVEDQDVAIANDDDRWRMWALNVPEGDEVATRDALRGDAEVEDAGLIYVAELTDDDGALPDTATRATVEAQFKIFVNPPPDGPVYDGTVPFLIVIAIVATILTVNWLRQRAIR